jgi:ssDNA-binding Zn-finger/Zn-ribbon topoisomerase 1
MIEASRDKEDRGSLVDVIDRLLDKGLVINADIVVSVAGVELLGVKVRAALASFATAAKYGLEFPSGTNLETEAWKEAQAGVETCPQCGKEVSKEELLNECCPWCGWMSAKAEKRLKEKELKGVPLIAAPVQQ